MPSGRNHTLAMAVGRRAVLAALAAIGLPWSARAQTPATPQAVPQLTPGVAPQITAPGAVVTPRPASPPVTAIDKTKIYYLFFDQQIDVNTMRALRRQLSALVEAGVSQINLVIDSPGGLVDPMLVTYSFIRALPATINTHAQGFVQSAATVLFLAGQERSADRTARFLFHPSSSSVVGTLTEQQVRERLNLVDTVENVVATIYQDRTSLTDEQVKRFAREEVILNSDQAKAAGIVDSVADLKIPGGNTAQMLFLD